MPLPPRLEYAQKSAVEVMAVEAGSPAEQAGILEEDLLISLGEQAVASVDDLHKLLTELPVEVATVVTLLRGTRRLERLIVPQEYPHAAPNR